MMFGLLRCSRTVPPSKTDTVTIASSVQACNGWYLVCICGCSHDKVRVEDSPDAGATAVRKATWTREMVPCMRAMASDEYIECMLQRLERVWTEGADTFSNPSPLHATGPSRTLTQLVIFQCRPRPMSVQNLICYLRPCHCGNPKWQVLVLDTLVKIWHKYTVT